METNQTIEIFFSNGGLSHIGQQFLSYLELDDLWSCRQVAKDWKTLADAELQKLKKHYSDIENEWWEQDVEGDDDFGEPIGELGEEFQRFWFEYLWVFQHFSNRRSTRDYIKFVQFMERYIEDNRYDFTILSPLHWAVKNEDFEAINLMMPSLHDIENHESQETYNYGTPPQEYALHTALKGSLEMFKLICEKAEWLVLDVNEALPVPDHAQNTDYFKGKYVTVMMRACLDARDEPKYMEKIVFMLENGQKYKFDFKSPDKKCESSPFAIACNQGNLALVNLLLEHSVKINLNNEDRQGQSGFVSACRKGHKEIVQRIIEVSDEKAIDLNLRDVELFTGLSVARKERRFAIIELLEEASKTKKIDLDAKGGVRHDELKWQLQHFGIEATDDRIEQLVLSEEWMQEEGDEFEKYWEPWNSVINDFSFHRSVPDLTAFVDFMKRYTAESKKQMRGRKNVLYYFKSPLHFAIEEKDLPTVQLLLPSCQNVEDEQKYDERIDGAFKKPQLRLLQSAVKSSLEIFQLILERANWLGIDVNETFPNGYSNVLKEACALEKLDFIKHILENAEKYGFNYKSRHDEYNLPFTTACELGYLAVVELLLLHSDKILLDDPDCESGLVIACQKGHVEVVQRLIEFYDEKGMDLNVKDCDGNTGLIAACMEGRLEIVKILVEAAKTKTIDLNAKNEFGLSALEMAREEDHDNIVEFLTVQISAAGCTEPKN